MTKTLIVIAHDMRSAHNLGSLFRTCEGLGVKKLYLTGYTPHPPIKNDQRLPHIGIRHAKQINKTALGAERMIDWEYTRDIRELISKLKVEGFDVVGLEQNSRSVNIKNYSAPSDIALLLGREVEGIDESLLNLLDAIVEIPMQGKKESLNVVQAASIAIYSLLL